MYTEEIEKISQVWPHWHAESMIGAGSFGRVYRVVRDNMGTRAQAAVKVIHIPQDTGEVDELMSEGMDEASVASYYDDAAKNLIAEINIMESLKTAGNIVAIEDYELLKNEAGPGWTVYIRMELLRSLTEYLKQGTAAPEVAVRIGLDICEALKACGKKKIIHRDIKPENIFVNEYGTFKLGDFGIARNLQHSRTVVSQKGTGMYMAPELYHGEQSDVTVDIYALGIVLYRLLNGGRFPLTPAAPAPVQPSDREGALIRRISGAVLPPPADAPRGLAEVILKACAFRPADRYASAEAFSQALSHALTAPDVPEEDVWADDEATVDYSAAARGMVSAAPEASPAGEAPQTSAPSKTTVFARNGRMLEVNRPSQNADADTSSQTPVLSQNDEAPAKDGDQKAGDRRKKEARAHRKKSGKKKKTKIAAILIGVIAACAAFFIVRSLFLQDPYYFNGSLARITDETVTSKMISRIGRDTKVTKLTLYQCQVSDEIIEQLGSMEKLTSIEIQDCTGFSTLAPLADLPDLDTLDLTLIYKADEIVYDMGELLDADFSAVKTLHLTGISFPGSGDVLRNFTGLEHLYMTDSDPGTLEFLDSMPSLTDLDISGLDLSGDICAPLSNCTLLEEFTADDTGLSDLSWCASCPALSWLSAANCSVTDLTPLAGCTALYSLTLDNNPITSLEGLETCMELSYLSVPGAEITDLSPLAQKSNLIILDVSDNQVTNVDSLADSTGMTHLTLSNNQIADISALSGMTEVTSLDLSGNQIENLDALSGMIKLTSLDAADNRIENIDGVANSSNLTTISLQNNQIADISALDGFSNLQYVDIRNNQITDVSVLSQSSGLRGVRMEENQITSLEGLEDKTGLVALTAYDNQITDISPLGTSLTSLIYLDLGNNQITDISPISDTPASKLFLFLENNQISDISSLPTSPRMCALSLYGNSISDYSVLENLKNMNSTDYLLISWSDELTAECVASFKDNLYLVDVPEDKRAQFLSDLADAREVTMTFSADPAYVTADEADSVLSDYREETYSSLSF